MRIDARQHFRRLAALHRGVMPADLPPLLQDLPDDRLGTPC
jgi:hypothetical protein